jgi:RNA polymerase-interacting CarD/CdnL/TRCF family regulator
MTFAVNDRVVHAVHGVGTVVRLVPRQLDAGTTRLYYEVSLSKGTIWVPVDGDTGGLRRLTAKGELAHYRSLLCSRPAPLAADHRQRHDEVAARLKAGTLRARCEVVRDLTAYAWHKPLCQSSAALLRNAQRALDEEWAAVTQLPVDEAVRQVQALLLEGRRVYEHQ